MKNKKIVFGIVLMVLTVIILFMHKKNQIKKEIVIIDDFCESIDVDDVVIKYNQEQDNVGEISWDEINYDKFRFANVEIIKQNKFESNFSLLCDNFDRNNVSDLFFSRADKYNIIGHTTREIGTGILAIGDITHLIIIDNESDEILYMYDIILAEKMGSYKKTTTKDIKKVLKLIIEDEKLFTIN